MPTVGSASPLANLVAQRARLAAARNRMGLEGGNLVPQHGGVMIPASPTPPSQPPAAVTSPAVQAMQGPPPESPNPQMQNQITPSGMPGPSGFRQIPEDNVQAPMPGQQFPLTPDQNEHASMLGMVQQFLNQHGPQQQALMDKQRAEQEAQMQPGTSAGDFQERTGRAPSTEEILIIAAMNQLRQELGREPTMDEIGQYLNANQQASQETPPNAAPVS